MGDAGQPRPLLRAALWLALPCSACTEDTFLAAIWPEDLIQVLLVTDEADVPLALPVQVFSPRAPIALEVPEGQRVKLHLWLLPPVFEGAALSGCQLELNGEGERVPDRAVIDSYVAGPFTAGVDGAPSFGLLSPEARPGFELHFSGCVPSQEICRRARVTPYPTRGLPDHDLRPVVAVDDAIAFFGLKPEEGKLGFNLFRFERGAIRPLPTPEGFRSVASSLCFDGSAVRGSTMIGQHFSYDLDGTLSSTEAGSATRPNLACIDGLAVEWGAGLRTFRGAEIPPLGDEHRVVEVVLRSPTDLTVLTSSAIFHSDGAAWVKETELLPAEKWHGIGGDPDQMVAVADNGNVLLRDPSRGSWASLGNPWLSRRLFDAEGLGAGSLLIAGQDGLLAIRRNGVFCELERPSPNNFRYVSLAPSRRTVFVAPDENSSITGDDAPLIVVELAP